MRARRTILLVLVAAFAGCASPTSSSDPEPDMTEIAGPEVPRLEAAEVLAAHRRFVTNQPDRFGNSSAHQAARETIANAFEALDGELDRRPYQAGAVFHEENLCLLHPGVNETGDWVVVLAHYDSGGRAAGQGAYDNGLGAQMVVSLATTWSAVATQNPVAFCLIDGGDRGYSGSRQLLEDFITQDLDVRAAMFLDGYGILWPVRTPLVAVNNRQGLLQIADEERDKVGIPDEYFRGASTILGGHLDEGPWFAADIPTLLLISNVEETGNPANAGESPVAARYPFLHTGDTVETMTLMAGGPETLERSVQNALDVAAQVLGRLAFDSQPIV